MGDLQGDDPGAGAGPEQPEQLDPHVRLIGNQPYLLVEFHSDEQGVELCLSCWGVDCEETRDGFRSALSDVVQALSDDS